MASVREREQKKQRDRVLRNLQARIRRAQMRIKPLRRKLRRIRGRSVPGSIIKEVEAQIAAEGWMEDIIILRFKKEARRASGHPRWKRLTPAYRRAKLKAGFGSKKNVRTGRLRAEILKYVHGTWKFGKKPRWHAVPVPEYSKYVERARPILLPPSRRELEAVTKRAKQLILEKMRKGAL
jgi:hypothetical protein